MSAPGPCAEDAILALTKTIAVIGLSANPRRDSHRISAYMQARGYRIVPVNPTVRAPILGQPVYARLADIPASIAIDLVNVWRRSEATDEPIDAAIARGARAVWLQLGIENAPGLQRARQAGLLAVHDRCVMVEHRRWADAG